MADARQRRRQRTAALVALVAGFLGLRLWVIADQSLWSDEMFSLALATGHSVEHPAVRARPELGDYLEPPGPVGAHELARYLEHDRPPAGPGRVVRAVRLSDTSPPLYYLALWAWTLVAGTSDIALRGLSLAAAVGSLPLIAFLARRLGGRRAVPAALVLYSLAPMSIHYSTEGRMYSLAWTLALGLAAASVVLRRRRRAPTKVWMVWSGLAAAGLLVHYFFVFVLAACGLWLASARRRVPWRRLALALGVVALAVAPWYLDIPASKAAPRLTAGWLDGFWGVAAVVRSPLYTTWALITHPHPWSPSPWTSRPLLALFALATATVVVSRRRRAAWLPALWLAASVSGPGLFDWIFRTHAHAVPRYALAGLPALALVVALACARWPRTLRALFLTAVAALWWPGIRTLGANGTREGLPYAAMAAELDRRLGPDDLAIVQSIPGGVAGLARYVEGPVPILSWVEGLGVRSAPADLERWARGRERIAYLQIHRWGNAEPAREWLERHAIERWRWSPAGSDAEMILFEWPARGGVGDS